jgi:hypothetical protein
MIVEDLPRLAALGFDLSKTCSADCADYHALRGYMRASGLVKGAARDGALIARALAARQGPLRIMIAGAGDTGLPASVANARWNDGSTITVVDRCPTPLKLCEFVAEEANIHFELRCQNFEDLSVRSAFDIIIAHQALPFIPEASRIDALRKFRHALVPGGVVLVVQRVAESSDAGSEADTGTIATQVMERLRGMGIPLPVADREFARRLERYAAARRSRHTAFSSPHDIEPLFSKAAFSTVNIEPIGTVEDFAADAVGRRRRFERYFITASSR